MDLTDADIEKITTPLWDRAKAEIAAGNVDAGVEFFDEAVSRARELQFFYVNRLTSLLSFIAEELGEEAVERALRSTGERFIRARRDTGVDWGALPASVRAKVVARAMLGNFGEVDVSEDDEKVVLSIRCGTGGRLVEEGRYEGDDAYVTFREHAPRTFMLDALPVYSAHCSINNEIQPIEWGGVPISIEHPVVAPETRCIHHIYKDVHAVPDDAYERIGKAPPPPGPHPTEERPMARNEEERRAPRVDDDLLTECGAVDDEADVTDAKVQGDFAGSELHLVSFRQCRVESATFTASRLIRAAFVDCVVVDSNLSGVLLDGRLERVEFHRCRLSGLQAPKSQFTDVAFIDCKADAATFRMTTSERAEFRDCNLVESDFYGAKLPSSRIQGCDLTSADFSKADLSRTRLQRSNLTDIRGGDALRGATISSDQLIPVALAVFAAMKIRIDDE